MASQQTSNLRAALDTLKAYVTHDSQDPEADRPGLRALEELVVERESIEEQARELFEKAQANNVGAADLDDDVHECAAAAGAEANNDGLDGQIRFLLDRGMSREEILDKMGIEETPSPS